MRSCVKTSIPASGISTAVAGSFYSPSSKDMVTAAANTLTLSTWCPTSKSIRHRFETTLPGRIVALDKLVLSSSSVTNNSNNNNIVGNGGGAPTDLLVALYSESLVAIMRWSSKEHTFRNVALFALSVEEVDGAVPVVEGVTSERSEGLPPLLRVDQNKNMILVLAQRRYVHSISMLVQKKNASASAVNEDAAASTSTDQAQQTTSTTSKKKTDSKKKKKQAVAWADDDEEEDNNNSNAKNQDKVAEDGAPSENNNAVAADSSATLLFDEESFYENQVTFSQPKTFDLLFHIKTAKNIRDVQFVQGFSEPTVAILREGSATWAGRVRLMTSGSSVIRALSCGVVIANIDEINEKVTVVREVDGLPYSSTQLCPLPASTMASLGGVLCLSAHTVSHVTFRGTAFSAIVNNLGRDESTADQSGNIRWGDMEFAFSSACSSASSSSLKNVSQTQHEKIQAKKAMLAAARAGHLKTFADVTATPLSETSILVSHAQDGSCDILDLTTTDNRTVSSIKCTSLSSTSVVGAATSLVTFPVDHNQQQQKMILLASKIHDSFLLQYNEILENNNNNHSNKQHKITVAPNGRLSHAPLAAAVDMDIVDYTATDAALSAEISRYAAEKARAEDKNNSNSKSAMNPYEDLITSEAPVLRAPPKPLSHRIKSSALLVASGTLPQHSYVTALRQHTNIDVVKRQNMDCSAIFSLGTMNPEASSLSIPEGKRGRGDGVAPEQSSSSSSSSSTVAPETVALLFGASSTTAVVGTSAGKLTQIPSSDSAFAVSERTIAAIELGFLSTSGANCDVFAQLTAKNLVIVSYNAAQTDTKLKYSRLDTIACPGGDDDGDSFRQLVPLALGSALVLTANGSIYRADVSYASSTGFSIDFNVVLDSRNKEELSTKVFKSESSSHHQQDKISFMSSLTLANRASAASAENSLIVLATLKGHLMIIPSSSSSGSFFDNSFLIENFFLEFPKNVRCSINEPTKLTPPPVPKLQQQNQASSSSSIIIDDLLLCRLHGNSEGMPDEHLTLVVRRGSGEITCFAVSLLLLSSSSVSSKILDIWKTASLLHDIDRSVGLLGSKSQNNDGSKFESVAEKKRKKELAEKNAAASSGEATNNSNNLDDSSLLPLGCNRLCYIPNIASRGNNETDAVYICGSNNDSQALVSDRGLLRAHPIRCPSDSGDGVKCFVRCAAPINCKALTNGIVLCEGSASVVLGRIGSSSSSSSSASFDLRTTWPSRRVPLPGTPHYLVYNSSNLSAVVVTSTLTPYRPTQAPYDAALKGGQQHNQSSSSTGKENIFAQLLNTQFEHEPISEKEGVPIPMQRRFSLSLMCAGLGWSISPASTLELLENEVVLSCVNGLVNLSKTNAMRPKLAVEHGAAEYVIVGTSFPQGDDVACRGRLLIFGVKLYAGARRLHLVHSENTKAPVSALCTVGGCIVTAIGSAVRIFALDPTGSSTGKTALVTCGFLANSTYITSLTPMKNFLIVGDVFQSVSLISLRPATVEDGSGGNSGHNNNNNSSSFDNGAERIVLLAQDRFSREITATGFLSSGQEAVLLGADSRDNLLILHYEPPRTAVAMVEQKRRYQENLLLQQQQQDEQQQQQNNENNEDNGGAASSPISLLPGMDTNISSPSTAINKNIRGGVIDVTTLQLIQSFKLSGSVSKMMRIRSPNPSTLSSFTGDNCSMYLTIDGEIGFVLPLAENEARVLNWATKRHTAEVESVGGLNVEMERSGRLNDVVRLQGTPALDLQHIHKVFVEESGNVVRKGVARRAGSTVEKILNMLAKAQDLYVDPMF